MNPATSLTCQHERAMEGDADEMMLDEDVLALIAASANSASALPKDSEAGRAIAALEISIHHLERSNYELEDFIKENGHDRDLRQAIGENIAVIARCKAVLEDLRKQAGITEPISDVPVTLSAAPVPVEAATTSGGSAAAIPIAVDVDVTEPAADASGLYL